jgi:hypothetical protein
MQPVCSIDDGKGRLAADAPIGSLGHRYDEGPRLVIEGVCEGREVFLQVLAYAPEDEEPGMKLDLRRPER